MKKNLPLIIRWIIAALFIISAIAKLYPSPNFALGTFEAKQLWPMGFDPTVASYFSRSLIAIEFGLGVAILQPHFLKRLIIPATTLLLVVFSIHLTYEIIKYGGGAGNCGCFGELIPMTPLQALIKNILAIGMLAYLWKVQPADQNSKFSYVLLIFTTIGLGMFAMAPVQLSSNNSTSSDVPVVDNFADFAEDTLDQVLPQDSVTVQPIINPADTIKAPEPEKPKAPEKVKSKYSKYVDQIPAQVKIDDGKKILCFFAPTCEHCMETAKTLTRMSKQIKGFPPVHIVFIDEGPEEIPAFFEFAGREYSYRVAPVIKFWEMIGNEYDTPGVVFLWNGNVRYFADGINANAFSENALKAALKKEP